MKMRLIPEEIITEILIQLPARKLWQLRCVSKSWRALIDSHIFINMHLNNSIQTNSNRTLVLSNGKDTFCLHVENLFDDNGNRKPNFPLKSFPRSVVLGSCNGLLLLSRRFQVGERICPSYGNDHDYGIWNPNTGEYKSLPDPLQRYQDTSKYYPIDRVYGFGFDSTKDEYKVVRVTYYFGMCILKDYCEADIYSLKSNSWRRFEYASPPLSAPFYHHTWCAFASDALHWAGKAAMGGWVILAFDIVAEQFRDVSQPDFSVKIDKMRMEEVNGKLCLISAREDDFIDIWMMREYGVKESWIKLLSISSTEKILCCSIPPPYSDTHRTRPVACSSLGNKIILSQWNGRLILCDLARDSREEISIEELGAMSIEDLDCLRVAFSCVDSLVRLSDYDTAVINLQNRTE